MFFSKKLKKYKNIQHYFFSRNNGFSNGIYKSLNCGIGSKDRKENVIKNLQFVSKKIGCKEKFLITLTQTHSNKVILLENSSSIRNKMKGDAIITTIKNIGIGVLTADCVPILLYEPKKKIIGCIHSGWKGAFNGIIKNTIKKIKKINQNTNSLIAVVGPCIGKKSYNVKIDFYNKFIKKNSKNKKFFTKIRKNNYKFDLRSYVNYQITSLGIKNIENIKMDTFSEKKNFYSYRRSCQNSEKDYGRCSSVILMT